MQGRYDSKPLALVVAITGIVATMPYIALQLVGIEVVLQVLGLQSGEDTAWLLQHLPLFIAFAFLAAYTYSSGLRAPALIAFVKDTLIYIVVIVAVLYLPSQVGGWDSVFSAATDSFDAFNAENADAIAAGEVNGRVMIPPEAAHWAYASLALGSALALFMYPHSITGVLATKNRSVIRRNAALLPAYSFLLGLIALLGFVAIAAGVQVENAQQSVPQLFENEFPGWFAGVAFAAIGIGALVPAAIMSIAAANLWTRNIYKAYLNHDATPAQEAKQSKLMSLLVKFGALAFVLALPKQFAINLQLLGGVWMLQTFPAIVVGLYTRWFHRYALLAGWAVGIVVRHLDGVRRRDPGRSRQPLRRPAGHLPGHRDPRLHRLHRLPGQPAGDHRPHRASCAPSASTRARTRPTPPTTAPTPATRRQELTQSTTTQLPKASAAVSERRASRRRRSRGTSSRRFVAGRTRRIRRAGCD